MSTVKFVPKKLEARILKLTEKLMPSSGSAETLEGELLRAINKILYRFYNDGDFWYKGYGCETAGPAAAFLYAQNAVDVKKELDASDRTESPDYEKHLFKAARKIAAYIESRETYEKNRFDMLDFASKYRDDDPDWDDEPYDDDDDCDT